jgi:adenylosuccinate synthase
MTAIAVVGLQWGDEAKGKIVDFLSARADVVARFNGGDNAGHTVKNEFGTFKLRLIPSGFSNSNSVCVIGPGTLINLRTIIQEVNIIQKSGIQLDGRLWISPRCHVVMPYHPLLEQVYESTKGEGRTGTTGRGMGPAFADRVSYNGIRIFDFANEDVFAEKLRAQLSLKNPVLEAYNLAPLDFDIVYQEKLNQYLQIHKFARESFMMLQEALAEGKTILLEGAQGALLDYTWGTYPFCTGSITLAGGATSGLGISPNWIKRVVGVAKAYTTRVGTGPMPTELHDEVGMILQNEGWEFGTVTGRARRCGWFDADLVRFTCQLGGVTELAITKLDVLDTLPKLKICIGYRHPSNGNRIWHYWEGDAHWLQECEPVYIHLNGWQIPTRGVRDFNNLPDQAQNYISKIEELVGVSVRYISVGPERDSTIEVSLDAPCPTYRSTEI